MKKKSGERDVRGHYISKIASAKNYIIIILLIDQPLIMSTCDGHLNQFDQYQKFVKMTF